MIYESTKICRICFSPHLVEILNLGDHPPANSLYRPEGSKPPYLPLRLMFCKECNTVQIGECVSPEYLFDDYLWVTGTSETALKYSEIFTKKALEYCALAGVPTDTPAGLTEIGKFELALGIDIVVFHGNSFNTIVHPIKGVLQDKERRIYLYYTQGHGIGNFDVITKPLFKIIYHHSCKRYCKTCNRTDCGES